MTIVVLAVSFILAIIGITYGFILRKKRKTTMINWSIWLGIIWLAFPIILAIGSFKISSILKEYKANPQGLTEEEQIIMRCKSNQEQLELIANEFWKRDHPDATKEDIKNLDLGPEGDLLGIKKGNRFIYYTGEPAIFNCPSDEDMEDIDYAIDHIDGDGYIHIKCIQNEQHNK
jgi:heme/copper-type cytochrome/quinol oxidase subunit 2